MLEEEKIKQELEDKFSYLRGKIDIKRERRISADVDKSNFNGVLCYLRDKMQFAILVTITGLDEGPTFGIIYHMARLGGIVINLKTQIPRENPVTETITNHFPNAEIYERELVDLFGIKVTGLAPGPRYPLMDDWPAGECPLRKDWKSNYSDPELSKKEK